MVAATIKLPNVRKIFVPSPDHVMADADLSGADARVVAWEAQDEDLMAAFDAGLKVHAVNAQAMFGSRAGPDGKKEPFYSQCKAGVHATNYGGSAWALARNIGWTVHESEQFQKRWFDLHPGIKEWHRRIDMELAQSRTVYNKFGYRYIFFDRIERALPEALAWIPQSTVAINTILGSLAVNDNIPQVKLLLQVHDSVVMEWPKVWDTEENRRRVKETLTVVTPYDPPLIIPWDMKTSESSWGEAA